jgi:hypothetical protein
MYFYITINKYDVLNVIKIIRKLLSKKFVNNLIAKNNKLKATDNKIVENKYFECEKCLIFSFITKILIQNNRLFLMILFLLNSMMK